MPTSIGRLGAAEVGRRDRLRLGPDHGPAHQPDPPHRWSAPISRRGWSSRATPGRRSTQLPTVKNLPAGRSNAPNFGDQKWQAELIYYFIIALVSGVLLVFAVLVLLYRRFLSPLVNMGSLLLAPLGAAIGLPSDRPAGVAAGADRHPDAVRHRRQELDPAGRFRGRDDGPRHAQGRGDLTKPGHKRAQPIVMTTVAMVAGMLPIALSLTGDGSWRAPMGITVIGGLIFSTAADAAARAGLLHRSRSTSRSGSGQVPAG